MTQVQDRDTRLPFYQSHAFLIGINEYQHVSPLGTAVNDALALAERLEAQHGYQVHPPLLNVTRAEMIHLLQEDLPALIGEEDRMLFYFAGHGIALDSDDNPKGYLVPADARPGETETLISMDVLHDAITSLPCKHGILIMDCCFAGAFKWSTGFRDVVFDLPGIIYEQRFNQYASDPAWQVITSSASDQKAVDILSNRTLGMREERGAEHSPFALALMDGLAGAADCIPKDKGDGVITATELYTYLRDRVEDETTEEGKRQSPSMFSLSKHDKGQYIFLHPTHRLNLPPIPKRNPFMGLKSYNESDTNLFYGRDRVIEALDKLSQTSPLIVVSGASGTGKSSVIKAGLLPVLRKKSWRILPVIRPGKEPMQSLKEAIPDLAAERDKKVPTVVIIDQYEELITQCLDPDDRVTFEAQLAEWLQTYPELRIIISIRSDFEPQFENTGLAAWWSKGRYIVPAFSQDELREVIIKPTIQEVLFFEPDTLVDKLVDAVNQAPGALPLLSFTLSELYHAYLNSGRTNRAFTLEDYEKLGGVIGALRTRANGLYDSLDQRHQHTMRKLMLRMVSLEGGELASKRVFESELQFSDPQETQRIIAVAHQLVDARLVQRGVDTQDRVYLEPAHDALVRAWAKLWEWIKMIGEEKLNLQNKLVRAVKDHQELAATGSKKARKLLWDTNPRLDLLEEELKDRDHTFNIQEEAFVKDSLQRRRKKRMTSIWVALGVIIVLAALTIYAFIQQGVAKEEALTANLRRYAAEADFNQDQDPMLAFRLAEAGYRTSVENSREEERAGFKDQLLRILYGQKRAFPSYGPVDFKADQAGNNDLQDIPPDQAGRAISRYLEQNMYLHPEYMEDPARVFISENGQFTVIETEPEGGHVIGNNFHLFDRRGKHLRTIESSEMEHAYSGSPFHFDQAGKFMVVFDENDQFQLCNIYDEGIDAFHRFPNPFWDQVSAMSFSASDDDFLAIGSYLAVGSTEGRLMMSILSRRDFSRVGNDILLDFTPHPNQEITSITFGNDRTMIRTTTESDTLFWPLNEELGFGFDLEILESGGNEFEDPVTGDTIAFDLTTGPEIRFGDYTLNQQWLSSGDGEILMRLDLYQDISEILHLGFSRDGRYILAGWTIYPIDPELILDRVNKDQIFGAIPELIIDPEMGKGKLSGLRINLFSEVNTETVPAPENEPTVLTEAAPEPEVTDSEPVATAQDGTDAPSAGSEPAAAPSDYGPSSGYGVSLAAVSTRFQAEDYVSTLKEKGMPDLLIRRITGKGGKVLYRVIAGPYRDQPTAEREKTELQRRYALEGFIVEL